MTAKLIAGVIPENVLDMHVLALGKTRSGKSSKLRLIVEHCLDRGLPVGVIDPKGDWWGIKLSRTGKSAGFPVVIFGGEHADVKINEYSGAAVAELVASGNRPFLIDLGGWMPSKRTKFFVDFASTLFIKTRGRRILAIDEVHNFAPQGKVMDPESGKALHWANRLASEGGGKGVTLLSASQRPQKVHKDYVTSHETLIACKVIHKLDRDAVKDWIDGCGDPEHGREVMKTLGTIEKKQAWVWCPEVKFGPSLVDFPMFSTYDSFKPQEPGDAAKLKGWASVDLAEVNEKLAAVIAEEKAKDPKELKAEIAKLKATIVALEKRLVDSAPAIDQDAIQKVEQRGFEAGRQAMEKAAIKAAHKLIAETLSDVRGSIDGKLADSIAAARKVVMELPEIKGPIVSPPASIPRRADHPLSPKIRIVGIEYNGALSKGMRVCLTAIAQHPSGVTREQLTVLTGYKRSSRDTFLQQLGSAGYVDRDRDRLMATQGGVDALGSDYEPLPTGDALRTYWLSRLGGGEQRILELAIDAYPNHIDRDTITEKTIYKRSSRDTFIQKLSSRELIEITGPGSIKAVDSLFG